jgi:hypothetical protein
MYVKYIRIRPKTAQVLPQFKGRLLDLLSNVRLGCKGLPRRNTIAYLDKVSITKKKGL